MKTICLLTFAVVLYTIVGFSDSRPQVVRIESLERMFAPLRDVLFHIARMTGTPEGLQRAAKRNRLQSQVGKEIPFPCDTTNGRSTTRPSSVHELRPGDIDVIAAMGDSLTAGNGIAASDLLDVLSENRGMTWSIGGQGTWREHLTLPNILKEFNTNLIGYSLNDSQGHHKGAQFNVAEPGAMSKDMPYMAKVLVKRIRADKRIDVDNQWKEVTTFVDLCYWPEERVKRSPEIHRKELIQAIDYLRDNLPRTLVNLVLVPAVGILKTFRSKPNRCRVTHTLECPCLFNQFKRDSYFEESFKMQQKWQKAEEEVGNDPRYRKKEDFAVVLQPFISKLVFPQKETPQGNVTDFSYLSEDCFHISQKGNARAANALWNNMLEPEGMKTRNWFDPFTRFLCPTQEHPYIYTWKNSIQEQPIDVKITDEIEKNQSVLRVPYSKISLETRILD